MTLLREAIGDSLRRARLAQSRTLREVSTSARVSLGYLSEVERGRKEASSELLAAICEALDVPLSRVLWDVSTIMADADGLGPIEPAAVPVPAAVPAPAAEPVFAGAEQGAEPEAASAPAGASLSAAVTAEPALPAGERPAAPETEAVPVPAGIGTVPAALGAPEPERSPVAPGSVVVTPGAGRPLPVETRIVIPAPRGDALVLVDSW